MSEKSINQKHKIIFGKYEIKGILNEGSFCKVYIVKNIKTQLCYAAKIEERTTSLGFLEKEAYFLYSLKGFGIPELITYGRNGKYNVLIQQLLGKSLTELFKTNKQKDKWKDLCLAAIQIIDRIKFIHSKNIVHRDIKPENFLIGNPDSSTIYIIDFGLSRKYRSSRTGKHIDYYINKTVPGTIRYLSLNATTGVEQTRRDDLESIAYMLIYLGKGKLPWSSLKAKTKIEASMKTYKIKKTMPIEQLCKGLPKEFEYFLKYVRNLKFEEEPRYNSIKKLFESVLKNFNEGYNLNFSWEHKFKKSNSQNVLKNAKILSQSRKSSPRIRLLKQLEGIVENSSKLKRDNSNLLPVNPTRINNSVEIPKNTEINNKNNENLIFNIPNSVNFSIVKSEKILNINKNEQFYDKVKNVNSTKINEAYQKIHYIKPLTCSCKNINNVKTNNIKIIPINKIYQNENINKIKISLLKNRSNLIQIQKSPGFINNNILKNKYLNTNINSKNITTNIKCIPLAHKTNKYNRYNSFTNIYNSNSPKKYSPINRSLISAVNDKQKSEIIFLKKSKNPAVKIQINSINSSNIFNISSNNYLSINLHSSNLSKEYEFKKFPYIKPKKIISYNNKPLNKYRGSEVEKFNKNKNTCTLIKSCKEMLRPHLDQPII